MVVKTFFVQFFSNFLSPLLNLFFCEVLAISVLYRGHLCMKCSFGISNFLEELSSLSHSLFSTISLHCSLKVFLSLLVILWNSAFKWVNLSLSPLPFTSLLFAAIFKALLRQPLYLLAFKLKSYTTLYPKNALHGQRFLLSSPS